MKTEIPQWILDCIDNLNPGRCAEAVEALLGIIENLEKETEIHRSGKPDWKDAPEWATYCAMDDNGSWWWYENKPPEFENGFWFKGVGLASLASKCEVEKIFSEISRNSLTPNP